MATMLCKTKGNADPRGKSRVYFTCHPVDFEKHFEKICGDIFATHDCAIYYTEDMTAPIPAEDLATDLESNNLFVVPVTKKLLTEPNRAMDSDIPFARQKHIPMLPIMMEPELDKIYARPDKFGELQYLDPNRTDGTEIPYSEKLKKFLESVLVSEETAKRVRAAFDAYIFLSYRKKDRRYANELMGLIHKNPEYRDIAIWYDEFLTPGESFRENIESALEKSKLFTLLVTPNLLEDANFVMTEEYPVARKSGINILPAEMVATDKNLLEEKYAQIPACVDAHNDAMLRNRLLDAIEELAIDGNNNEPEHIFLIGLAYLDGIDVETDRRRGLEMITYAAEADFPEAMKKLYHIHINAANYQDAVHWAQRLVHYYKQRHGEEHPDTLCWMSTLAFAYCRWGKYQIAQELCERTYTLRCKVLGEEHPDTLDSLHNLAAFYSLLGDRRKALKLTEKACALQRKVLGEDNSQTLSSLYNRAWLNSSLGNNGEALEQYKEVLAGESQVSGDESPAALAALHNLAATYGMQGDHQKALENFEKAYAMRRRVLGEEDSETLKSLECMVVANGKLGNFREAIELNEKLYPLMCKALGEEHPLTLHTLFNFAWLYSGMGEYQKAWDFEEKAYTLRYKVLGSEHPDTQTSLAGLRWLCGKIDDGAVLMELMKRSYDLRCEILGEEHPLTMSAFSDVVFTCLRTGHYEKALALAQKVYDLQRKRLGEEHPDTVASLNNIAAAYGQMGDYEKAIELFEAVYAINCKNLGEDHKDTLGLLYNLAMTHEKLANYPKALELYNKAYDLQAKRLGRDHPDALRTLKAADAVRQKLRALWKFREEQGLCRFCGGKFKGLFKKVCSQCGKPKNY